jgi:hypothetical protein
MFTHVAVDHHLKKPVLRKCIQKPPCHKPHHLLKLLVNDIGRSTFNDYFLETSGSDTPRQSNAWWAVEAAWITISSVTTNGFWRPQGLCHRYFPKNKVDSPRSQLPMKISGVRSINVAADEHTAIIAAIRYLENATN